MSVKLIHNHDLGTASDEVNTSSRTGDYIGFTYNGIHSSKLGIIRTSDGSRFNENLLPTIQDKTVQVPGGDGTYFFGSYYTQRQFNISFAFDSLTEKQFADIQKVFGDKKIHDLIFDERPYKIYKAKVTGTATIKYIVFDENDSRVYKGEGSIQFTCYNPYAICEKKFLIQYPEEEYPNKNEWKDASGLNDDGKDSNNIELDQCNSNTLTIVTYNPGVKDSDWQMFFKFDDSPFDDVIINLQDVNGLTLNTLKIKGIKRKGQDTHVCINTKNNLLEGVICEVRPDKGNVITSVTKTGNLYNEFLSGSFFKIPIGSAKITLDGVVYSEVGAQQAGNGDTAFRHLFYNYYYF